jgi:hypothetical protein
MFGLAGSGMPVSSQVVNGSATQSKTTQSKQVKTAHGSGAAQKTGGSSKLKLNQQVLRQQTPGSMNGGKQQDPLTPSAYCNTANKGRANNQLTPPPPGQAGAKGKKLDLKQQTLRQQKTGGVNGGKQADPLTPSAYCNTAGRGANQQTKGKANQQITKGNAVQTTAAAGPK